MFQTCPCISALCHREGATGTQLSWGQSLGQEEGGIQRLLTTTWARQGAHSPPREDRS